MDPTVLSIVRLYELGNCNSAAALSIDISSSWLSFEAVRFIFAAALIRSHRFTLRLSSGSGAVPIPSFPPAAASSLPPLCFFLPRPN